MSRPEPHAALSVRRWPLLVVALGVLVGLVLALVGEDTWRPGCLVIGASLLAGGVVRLVLPARGAGLLEVRGKPFDVTVLLLVGAAVVVLALVVPPAH